jgi:hypothetical protein
LKISEGNIWSAPPAPDCFVLALFITAYSSDALTQNNVNPILEDRNGVA